MKSMTWLGVLLLPAITAMAGAPPGADKVLSLSAHASRDPIAAGSVAELDLKVELHGSWHINSIKPKDPMLIPTKLTLEPVGGLSFGEAVWPAPREKRFEFSEEPLLVYQGKFEVKLPLILASDAVAGSHTVAGKLRYQACDDERCLAPKEEPISLVVNIVAGGVAAPVAPETTPAPSPAASPVPSPVTQGSLGERPLPVVNDAAFSLSFEGIQKGILSGNYFLPFVILFLGGLGLCLTPCVYPVIPITLGYFASQSEKRGGKTFLLALVYVLGIAAMYSTLGVAAALTGKAFGTALSNPWVLVFEAATMVALSLSMFGLWELNIPASLSAKLSDSPSGLGGAFFMGLTVGVVAAPCVGPFVLSLFVFVSQMKSVALGFSMFFVLALGLGFPFLILGTASGAISRMPRSGEWMVWIKHVFGFVLLGMALYFLRPLVGDTPVLWSAVVLALAAALWLGLLSKVGAGRPGFRLVKQAVGFLSLLVAVALATVGMRAPKGPGIAWAAYDQSLYAQALEQGKPVLVDFTAEWCLPCKELEHSTFAEASVKKAAERFVTLRADGTVASPAVNELLTRFEVQGFPTVLMIDSKGRERGDLRVVGFVGPEDFRDRLSKVD